MKELSAPARLTMFVVALAVLFGAAWFVGSSLGPAAPDHDSSIHSSSIHSSALEEHR